jgi:hypothetical protein
LQFDSKDKLLLLRAEHDAAKKRILWRLYALVSFQPPELLHEQDSTNWSPYALAFAPDGDKFLVRDDGDGRTKQGIYAFDAKSGREIWNALSEWDSSISWNPIDPMGRRFSYRRLGVHAQQIVSLSDFQNVGTGNYFCGAMSASGAQFASGWLYPDPSHPKYTIRLGMDWHQSYDARSFSPDGRYIAWGTEEGVVLVADIPEVQRRLSDLR